MKKQRWGGLSVGLWALVAGGKAAWAQEAGQAGEALERAGRLPAWQQILEDVMMLDLFNITLWRLGLAVLLLLLGFSLRGYLLDKLLAPVKLMAAQTRTSFDDQLLTALRSPLGWVLNLVAVYMAMVIINPPASVMTVSVLLMQTLGTALVAWVVLRLIDVVAVAFANSGGADGRSEMEKQLIPLIVRVLRMVLFVFVAIAIIQQWGYDVTSLIAGLGIGGLAFALAAKPTLENWFGSVMIFSDRPFAVGDWVKTNVGEGVVEDVGLRSTRIRTFTDTLISVPNADIAAHSVENCSAMTRRRIYSHIQLVYGTRRAQVEQILQEIRQRLVDDPRIEDDSWKVVLDKFGPSSIDVLIHCWALTTAYREFQDIKQDLYLDVMTIVEEANTAFAVPSEVVHVRGAGPGAPD